MTWLLIDAGNTAIKWARGDAADRHFTGGGVQSRGDIAFVQKLAAAWSVPPPEAVFGVCVADPATRQNIEAAVRVVCGRPMRWFESEPSFGTLLPAGPVTLINGYRTPAQLGADRWHALIAAATLHRGQSLLVASAGTATTVDSVIAGTDGSAHFVGGVIAPGFALMRASLAQGTAQLPLAAGRVVRFPDTTDDAIATGVFRAQLGVIERCAHDLAAEVRRRGLEAPRLVLAGGHGGDLHEALERTLVAAGIVQEVAIDNALVLRGLAIRVHTEQALAGDDG
jgi:type III pantothenate kinase